MNILTYSYFDEFVCVSMSMCQYDMAIVASIFTQQQSPCHTDTRDTVKQLALTNTRVIQARVNSGSRASLAQWQLNIDVLQRHGFDPGRPQFFFHHFH